jgi:hypothetical protein
MRKVAEQPLMRRPPDQRQRVNKLQGERRKLTARLQKVNAELSRLEGSRPHNRVPTAQELERWLNDLTEGLPDLPPLPADFSRADIYDDHD